MTKDEIIFMAHEAYQHCDHIPDLKIPKEFIERFAQMIATAERKEWAKEFAGLGEWTAVHILESREQQ